MARPIPCDLCRDEDAAILVSDLKDGSTVGVGGNCFQAFVMGQAQAAGLVALPAELVPAELGGTAAVEEPPQPPQKAARGRRRPSQADGDDQVPADDVTAAGD